MHLTQRFWFLKHISFFLTANLVKAGIPFLILPILTRYLNADEYGLWSVFQSLFMLAVTVTGLGIPMIIGRNFHQQSAEEHARLTFGGLVCISLFCFLLLVVTVLGAPWLQNGLFSMPFWVLLLLPVLCWLHNIEYFCKIILLQKQKAFWHMNYEIVFSALSKFGGLALVVFVLASWISLVEAFVAGYALSALLAIIIMVRMKALQPRLDIPQSKALVAMSWPFIFHALGGMIMLLSDRLILERMSGPESVGIYSVGAQIGTASLLFFNAFNFTWGPWMHRELNAITPARKSLIVRYSYYYFLSALAVSLAGAVFAWLYITYLVDASYHDALPMAYWIIAGTGVYGCSYAITHYLIFLGKTKTLPIFTGISALFNIVLTIILVNMNGPIGAAQATFAAYVLMFILNFTASQIYLPMPWLSFWKKNI